MRPADRKKASTSSGANDGEFATSTTTCAPARASASPAPVTASTPVLGDAATVSCPAALSTPTSLLPTAPLPPMTTTFMTDTLNSDN